MPEETLEEKLKKANDDYHEAVDEILSNDISVEVKVRFGGCVCGIFKMMKQAEEIIKAEYEETPVE